jgi:hypothetical protein
VSCAAAGAGGCHFTRKQFADAIQLAMGGPRLQPLPRTENLVPTAIGYFQPITRGELSQLFGKEVSRDIIGQLRPPRCSSRLLSKQKLLASALPGDLSGTQDLINIEERAGEDLEEPPLALSAEDL